MDYIALASQYGYHGHVASEEIGMAIERAMADWTYYGMVGTRQHRAVVATFSYCDDEPSELALIQAYAEGVAA